MSSQFELNCVVINYCINYLSDVVLITNLHLDESVDTKGLILSTLCGLFAFAFLASSLGNTCIYIKTHMLANNQDFSFFGPNRNILIFKLIEKIKVCCHLDLSQGLSHFGQAS